MTANSDLGLKKKVAIVTGGSRGIGRAVIELLAAHGARLVINYVNDEAAATAALDSVKKLGAEAISFKADVSRLTDAQKLIQATIDHFGSVDILVCNAGVWEGAPVDELTEERWDKTLDVNLKGTWSVCRAAVPFMKNQRSGKIVIISSTAGQRGEAGYSNYASSKGGQIAFVKSLADELGQWKINVNAVAPGWVDTNMTADDLGGTERRESILSTIPLRSIATVEDVAGPIVFLCTTWARHITGAVLNVNGGSVLSS